MARRVGEARRQRGHHAASPPVRARFAPSGPRRGSRRLRLALRRRRKSAPLKSAPSSTAWPTASPHPPATAQPGPPPGKSDTETDTADSLPEPRGRARLCPACPTDLSARADALSSTHATTRSLEDGARFSLAWLPCEQRSSSARTARQAGLALGRCMGWPRRACRRALGPARCAFSKRGRAHAARQPVLRRRRPGAHPDQRVAGRLVVTAERVCRRCDSYRRRGRGRELCA